MNNHKQAEQSQEAEETATTKQTHTHTLPHNVACREAVLDQGKTDKKAQIFYMWNDVWNDVKTTPSCEEQPVFGDSTTRPGGTCGSAAAGTIYCTFMTASKHAQHSAICWAARWNARATNRSLFPLLPDLLGRKLERPGSPTWEEAPKLCLVLRTG